MTEPQLKRMLRTWQKRIRLLTGWKLEVRFGTSEELIEKDGSKLYGRVEFDRSDWSAEILIRHPDNFEDLKPASIEETLVHELLHLIWIAEEELAINIIAETLCAAYRKKK